MTSAPVIAMPATGRQERISWQVPAGLLLAALIAVLPFAMGGMFKGADLEVYRAAGSAVLHGDSPYDFALGGVFRFIYTPFAAIPFALLAILGSTATLAIWTFLSALALEAVIWISLRLAGVESVRRRAAVTLAVTVAAIPLTPVLQNVWLGQINLILLGLVLADLGRRSGRFRGAGVGIAAGIKLTPLIFIAYLLVTRQFRAAWVAIASFAATILLGFAVMPSASWKYWTETFFDTSRMFPIAEVQAWNHSLRGLIAPLAQPEAGDLWFWLVVSAVVGIGGLLVARLAALRGNELAGLAACGVTSLVVSPVSWPAQWVWCVPLLVAVASAARGGMTGKAWGVAVTWLVFLAPTYYWFAPGVLERQPWPNVAPQRFGQLVVYFAIVGLVVFALWLAPRAEDRGPLAGRPEIPRPRQRV